MNTTITNPAPDTVRRLTTRQLGAVEAKRMLLHVSYLVCIAVTALSVATLFTSPPVGGLRPMNLAYAALLLLGTMFYPLTTVVAANRVGSSTLRRASQETLGVTPTAERQRTVAACLGVVRGPVVVGGAIMVLADLVAPLVDDTGGLAARNILSTCRSRSPCSAADCSASPSPGGSGSRACSPWLSSRSGSAISRWPPV
jgi:hypothetical protein